jgi:hypothetical protein
MANDVDIWDVDYPEIHVGKNHKVEDFVKSRFRGSVRLSLDLICTKEEFEEKKRRVLGQPLP